MSGLKNDMIAIARDAKKASLLMGHISSAVKEKALLAMADGLEENKSAVFAANKKDVKAAAAKKLSPAFIDRLTLNEKRIKSMAASLRQVASQHDPIGEVIKMWTRPNGLWIGKLRVPLGVIGVIYESRPNVTADCIGLCLKAGNCAILRGGSEAINSNIAIFDILNGAAKENGIPDGAISLVKTTDRKAVHILLTLSDYVDLIIPRGGESLIKEVAQRSKIPVLKHYKGICHVYVDEDADLNMAEKICFNAKVQRPSVCNAMETLLVNEDVAARFLPSMAKKYKEAGVEIRGCPMTRRIVKGIKAATEKDWSTEYLGLIISIKVVKGPHEAIEHINKYGTKLSDAIVTENYHNAVEFLRKVDSAAVYVNASTRFTDGGEFGFGAEIGISTDKFHARGPVGVEELTSYKYIIYGDGQVRE
ncbi:MAG: glutamate-5-semialdehyde dehydrogenase [Candidatus Omnitrophica bacterium]|nr:glutamate-5-semialdehyde dehydrogenase [Candidatus Omnitrophota bacterium]MDD5310778.1 glutamate-5-semialdehyde dehydrogenase [Candidatus Omnitrophota bacterium]MDD5545539.1 glutamate-5-semialdehyde dehydrogenase [Candidatus Omnitrophota bacterium]